MSKEDDIKFIKKHIEKVQTRNKIIISIIKFCIFEGLAIAWIILPIFGLILNYNNVMGFIAGFLGVLTYVIGGLFGFYYLFKVLIEKKKITVEIKES